MYLVVGCPDCRQFQLTIARKRFTCKYCRKNIKVSKLNVHYSSDRHDEALNALYRLKKEELSKV
ncbi:MAG: hypothetical protein L6M37_05000 [Candidatus Methylarchaceae archaeon HK02M1]|nr:hypothetical protein [Candidatus Methylarchaceae archaeon HK02M1]